MLCSKCNKDFPFCKLKKRGSDIRYTCHLCSLEEYNRNPLEYHEKQKRHFEEIRANRPHSVDHEKMWQQLDNIGLLNDVGNFTDSEDLNDLLERYKEALLLVLAGLEDKLPSWLGPEE